MSTPHDRPVPQEIGFSDYQHRAMDTASYPDIADNMIYPALGLASESGEVLGKIKKLMRDDPSWGNGGPYSMILSREHREALRAELGDVLWYLAVLATECGINLHDVARSNLVKLQDRSSRNVISGSGDNR